ncbi:MAG: FlgD immunoglobulin-like domain containing protein [Candidatus Eiseniibacteriota bacterium]
MRSVRTPFVALTIALVVLARAPSVQAAPADSLPDTTGILTPWRLVPAAPCIHDSVGMVVRGFVDTPCELFLGAEAITPLYVRIRRQVNVDLACFAPPTIFYPVPLPLGRFPAGPHRGIVEIVTRQVRSDGSSTTLVQQFGFDFVVAADCSIPPPPTPGPPPGVHRIGTEPPRPCAGRPTSLVLEGGFSDGCGQVIDAYVHDPSHVELTLKLHVLPDTACTQAPVPWRQEFALGSLPSGPHRTNITLQVIRRDSTGTGFVRETHYGSHEFFVSGDCDSIPPPVPPPPPYVNRIVVGPDRICGHGPVCPGDSIPVTVSGAFPHNCFSFRRIQLIPSPITVFPPPPPTVRIIVDDGGCLGRPCLAVPTPWSASVRLPPMVSGDYVLEVELAEVSCSDTYPPGQLHGTEVRFGVAPSCPDPVACLIPGFAPWPGSQVGCNATVSKLQAAELTFLVRPTVTLAGLQGEFRLDPSDLEVMRIEAIGPAEGMLLDWTATPDGARFVMFAPSGAPIPPPPDGGFFPGDAWPVLRVTVASLTRGALIPDRTVVTTENLLGSDIEGGAVPLCFVVCPSRDFTPTPGRAIICGERICDFNVDGLHDVRDLVLMVQCVNDPAHCTPDAPTRFDCDGDGSFAIADVLCCARHVLGRPPCADCPPDTVRPEPDVAVSFDTPRETAAGVALPIRISRLSRLGGAMLTLEAPLDRYNVIGFGPSSTGEWLALHEVRDGRLVLGLIDVQVGSQLRVASSHELFTLTLALEPGQPPGGRVAVVAGQFSGPDGVTLGVNLGRPSQTLPGTEATLSRNQPNPFSTETAFTLDLAAAADVVVGIYDLRGRAVATLHRAPLGPGPHAFRWDGRRPDGSAAPNGVYFYKATVGGTSLARKLILMRGN